MALWGRKSKPSAEGGDAGDTRRPIEVPVVDAIAPAAKPSSSATSPSVPPDSSPPRAQDVGAATGALEEPVLKRRAAESKQLLLGFGEVVSVLMRSPQFRTLSLAQLEELVVPAIAARQFIVAEAQSRSNGLMTPVATALWAVVSQDVDERLSKDVGKPLRLAPSEWCSGEIPWLILVAGDKRIIQPMLQNVQTNQLKGRSLKTRIRGSDGHVEAGTLTIPSTDPSSSRERASGVPN